MNIALSKNLEEFISEQVKSGRFENKEEVVSTALRQLESFDPNREKQVFETAFRDIDRHSTEGEPTAADLVEIDRIVKSVRALRSQDKAA